MRGKKGDRRKYAAAGVALLLLICAASVLFLRPRYLRPGTDTAEVTIYLDHGNQAYVRAMVAMYENLSEIAQYSEESEIYPRITWKLVDKSGLTARDYREELLAELEAGEGPDLIFLDEYSCEDPAAWMEAGYFADLSGWMESDTCVFLASRFLPGTLEAGQNDGRQYLIPVSVDMPILCTTQSRLSKLGLSEDDLKTTDDILAAARLYQENTGESPFDSSRFLEGLFGDEEAADGKGTAAENAIDGGEAFAEGAFLFLTAGIDNYRILASQLALLPEEEEIVFLPLAGTEGESQAVLRQMVAVNQNTANRTAALGALNAFFVGQMDNYAENLPVDLYFDWAELLSYVDFLDPTFAEASENGVGQSVGWAYGSLIRQGVESARLPVFDLPEEGRTKSAEGRVLTVMLPDTGWEPEGTLADWIRSAAREYEERAGIAVEICWNRGADVVKLLMNHTAADITLTGGHIWPYPESDTLRPYILDYEQWMGNGMLARIGWKEGALESGAECSVPMIPAGLRGDGGLCGGFVISGDTELPGEAMEFLAFCFEDEGYGQVLKQKGWESVLEE